MARSVVRAGEGLSDRYFTSQDIPVKEEVTSSPPNGPEDSGSDFCPQFSHQPRRFSGEGGPSTPQKKPTQKKKKKMKFLGNPEVGVINIKGL